MKRLLIVILFGLAFLVPAVAQWNGCNAGWCSPKAASAGAYVGPGNVVSSSVAWYSCARGYNTADTANACNVCLPSDTVCADITLSNGKAVLPGSLATCNITTVICTVKTAYDKTTNGRNITNATEAQRPTFRPAMASNGCPTTALPCMLFNGGIQRLVSGITTFSAQPLTASIVFNNAATNAALFDLGGSVQVYRFNTNGMRMAAGGAYDSTVSDTTNHAGQFIYNGASSARYVDGVSGTGSAGTNTLTGNIIYLGGSSGGYSGYVSEIGFWSSDFSSGVSCASQSACATDMNTNQHSSANGYNF